ncbi:PepSY domain-containing protein [Senegalia sp. (in: firmicutes)]|uniref:PepSY domain-containing protein n=1 Tax=Senegalia sp. (in: firmicutes) TaxID=1924098 RepID=UPI003F97B489
MKKKWLLPLFLILILSLAACNDVETPTDDTTEMDPNVDEKANESALDEEEDVDATEDQEADEKANESPLDEGDVNTDQMKYEDITLSPQEAVDKFIESHADSKITEMQLDKNLNDYYYKIEGYDSDNDYEVKVNPVTGDIVSDDEDLIDLDDDDDKGEITKDHIAKIDSILDKAMNESGEGSNIKEWSLEYDDNKLIFEVEIEKDNNDIEYTYDLESGELIEKDD